MDFVHDTLADGRTVRVLTVLDVYTRECVALVAQPAFRGEVADSMNSSLADTRHRRKSVRELITE